MLRNWFFDRQIDPSQPHYAGLQTRLFVMTMDLLFITLLVLPIFWLQNGGDIFKASAPVLEKQQEYQAGLISKWDLDVFKASVALTNIFSTSVLMLLLFYLYWSSFFSTPAKWLMGLSIADAQSLQPPSRKQLGLRALGFVLTGFLLLLPIFYIPLNKKRQGLHDKIAGTVVVYHRVLTPEGEKKKQTIQLIIGGVIFMIGVAWLFTKGFSL